MMIDKRKKLVVIAMPDVSETKIKLLIVSFGLLAFGDCNVFAEGKIDFELRADYFGKYIWRGQNISDDPVFQPSISAGYAGLTASIWGNIELTNINDNSGDFSEIDYSLDYSAALPGM